MEALKRLTLIKPIIELTIIEKKKKVMNLNSAFIFLMCLMLKKLMPMKSNNENNILVGFNF